MLFRIASECRGGLTGAFVRRLCAFRCLDSIKFSACNKWSERLTRALWLEWGDEGDVEEENGKKEGEKKRKVVETYLATLISGSKSSSSGDDDDEVASDGKCVLWKRVLNLA